MSELDDLKHRISDLEEALIGRAEREAISVPTSKEGIVGSERLVRINDEYRLYRKFPSGWKYAVMYVTRPDEGPATSLDELSDVALTTPSAGQVLKYGSTGWINDTSPITTHDITSAYHSAAGLTTGHFLKASGATAFGFAAHGLTYSDVGAEQSGAVSSHASLQTGVHGISITAGKTLNVSNTITLTATDGSTLAIGTGGTLGSAAYTASGDYATSGHNHDLTYLGISAKAADSDKLDGSDSSAFASSGHNHDLTYLGISAKAADADKLDGNDSTAFAVAANGVTNGDSHNHSGGDGAQIDHTGLSNLNSASYTHLTATNHTDLTDGGATTLHKHDHGGMDGLSDDDHTQYTLKATLTEQGDLYYASAASTPAALAHGNSGDLLQSGGHAANPSWLAQSTFAVAAKGVTNGDSHDHSGGDGAAIVEAAITLADNSTNDVSITKHGFCPKAPNDTTKYLRGDGTWATSGGVTNGDSHDHYGGDGAQIDHTRLSNIGSVSHSTLDSHVGSGTYGYQHLPVQTSHSGEILGTNGTIASWQAAGTGDVTGAASSTDNEIVRFHSTTGKVIQKSAECTINDSGTINIPTGQTYNINGSPHTHTAFGALANTDVLTVSKTGATIQFSAKINAADSYVVAGLGSSGSVGILYLNDDVSGAPWSVTAYASGLDFGGANIETDTGFSVNGAAGASSTFTVVSAIGLDGGVTKYKTRSLTVAGGIITAVGAESGWTTIS